MTIEQRRAQSILGLNRIARKLVLDAQTATKTGEQLCRLTRQGY